MSNAISLFAENIEVSADLKKLAEQANYHYDRSIESLRTSLSHAWYCGKILLEAKAKVKHGEWEAFVRENCKFSVRTSQQWIR